MKTVKKAKKPSKAAKAKAKSHAKHDAEEIREMYRAAMILSTMLSTHVKYIGKLAKIPKKEVELITGAAQGIGFRTQGWLERACVPFNDAQMFDGVMDDFCDRAKHIYDLMWDTLGTVSHRDFGRKAKKRT